MKKIIALIAGIACALLLGAAAVTWATDNTPTVVFDVSDKTFSFENCKKYTYTDAPGQVYPNLFPNLEKVMPGNSIEQNIKVKIINNNGSTIKMSLRVEAPNDETLNDGYAKLLEATGDSVTFSAEYEQSNGQYAELKHKNDTAKTAFYKSGLGDSVYLGAYNKTSETREIKLTFAIDASATDEKLEGLRAAVDWVFVAEIIKSDDGGGTDSGGGTGGGTIGGGTGETEPKKEEEAPTALDQTLPRNENRIWVEDMVEDHVAYIVGYEEDGLVHPERPITRAEVATIIFRLMTEEMRTKHWASANTFVDVPSTAWYNNAISTLLNAGIISGYGDAVYEPNQNITRAELIMMLSKVVTAIEPKECPFNDIEGHWAQEAIANAYSIGLISGYPNGTFGPDREITRAEAVAIFNRLLGREPTNEDIIHEGMVEWPDNMDQSKWYYLDIQEATNSHEHGYYSPDHVGNREYWVTLEMNVEWQKLEKSDATATTYYASNENYKMS